MRNKKWIKYLDIDKLHKSNSDDVEYFKKKIEQARIDGMISAQEKAAKQLELLEDSICTYKVIRLRTIRKERKERK